MRDQILALSFQSVAELWHWAEANRWEKGARERLDAFLRRFLVIPYDYELARVWAWVMEESKREGRRFEAGGLLDCRDSGASQGALALPRQGFHWAHHKGAKCDYLP